MAGEQSFKAVVNDTNPDSGGKSYALDITGANYNHFLGKKIGDSCLLYTSPSPRDVEESRMPSSA